MTTENDSVKNVSVISTGTAALHPEHMYGSRKPALWWVTRSKEWVDLPVNVFVIEHQDGLVLFDTGMDPAAAAPDYWSGAIIRWFLDHVFRFDVTALHSLASSLDRAGYRPEDVKTAVLSHLHFDHVGGISDIPGAAVYMAPDSWDLLVQSANPEREYIPRRQILVPGVNWKLLDFRPTTDPDLAPFTEACDVMGDGSLMVVATPGHVTGSVSMLIRRASSPPILLIGDLTYSEDLLMKNQFAATGDKALLAESFAKVQAMKANNPELVIIASHDLTAAAKLATARSPVLAPA